MSAFAKIGSFCENFTEVILTHRKGCSHYSRKGHETAVTTITRCKMVHGGPSLPSSPMY